MDEALRKELVANWEDARDELRKTVKLHPSFAKRHPEVYEAFKLEKEVDRARKLYKEPEMGGLLKHTPAPNEGGDKE